MVVATMQSFIWKSEEKKTVKDKIQIISLIIDDVIYAKNMENSNLLR